MRKAYSRRAHLTNYGIRSTLYGTRSTLITPVAAEIIAARVVATLLHFFEHLVIVRAQVDARRLAHLPGPLGHGARVLEIKIAETRRVAQEVLGRGAGADPGDARGQPTEI